MGFVMGSIRLIIELMSTRLLPLRRDAAGIRHTADIEAVVDYSQPSQLQYSLARPSGLSDTLNPGRVACEARAFRCGNCGNGRGSAVGDCVLGGGFGRGNAWT